MPKESKKPSPTPAPQKKAQNKYLRYWLQLPIAQKFALAFLAILTLSFPLSLQLIQQPTSTNSKAASNQTPVNTKRSLYAENEVIVRLKNPLPTQQHQLQQSSSASTSASKTTTNNITLPNSLNQLAQEYAVDSIEPIYNLPPETITPPSRSASKSASISTASQDTPEQSQLRQKLSQTYTLTLNTTTPIPEVVENLNQHPEVEYAEPNYIYYADLTPNDPEYPQLWGLNNTSQTGGLNDADIDAPEAWDIITNSKSTVVGVIDSGIDYTHLDLIGNMWTNSGEIPGNNIDDDNNGYVDDYRGWDFHNNDNDPMDDAGHGTHVAGTIGAVGNNNTGVTGVSWQASLMPLKFLNHNGSGFTDNAAAAVIYAADMGAKITNNSWGGGSYSQTLYDAISYAQSKDSIFVAAAGNSSKDLDKYTSYPSSYDLDNIISVAATDHQDNIASFSNYGLNNVDLAAPGLRIFSTTPDQKYDFKSGTSMAAPHVAGATALILSQNPNYDTRKVKNLLISTVDSNSNLSGTVKAAGRLNLHQALNPKEFVYLPQNINSLVDRNAFNTKTINLANNSNKSINWNLTSPLPAWITLDKTSGTIQANDIITITITFDASILDSQTYSHTLSFSSTHPETSSFDIPVTATARSTYSNRWAFNLGGQSTDYMIGHVIDSDTNMYTAGHFAQNLTLGQHELTTTSSSDTDGFLAKIKPKGEIDWIVQVGNSTTRQHVRAITIDQDNNIYIAGDFIESLTIQDSTITSDQPDFYVAKFNPNGELQWLRKIDSGQLASEKWSLAVDSQNAYYLSAEFSNVRKLIKFNSNGSQAWEKTEDIYDIAIDSNDNLLATGLTPLIKYDPNGKELYRKNDIEKFGLGYSLAIDINDNAIITGQYHFFVSPFIDPDNIQVLIANYDPNGSKNWEKRILGCHTTGCHGVNFGDDVATDPEGNIYLSGRVAGNVYIDGNQYALPQGKPTNIFITKLNSAGKMLYVNFIGNKTWPERPSHIVADEFQSVYLSGGYKASIRIDYTSLNAINDYDGFVAKYTLDKAFPNFQTPENAGQAIYIDNLPLSLPNAYVSIPDQAGQLTLHPQGTIELWLKPMDERKFTQSIFFREATNPQDNRLSLEYEPQENIITRLYDRSRLFHQLGADTHTAIKTLPLNKWVHIAITRNNDKGAIFYNGEWRQSLDITTDQSVPASPSANLYLGSEVFSSGNTNLRMTGVIDDLRISNTVRDVEQHWSNGDYFKTLDVDEDTLGYWQFDGSINDSSPNNHHGSISGEVVFVPGITTSDITPTPTPKPSLPGKALYLDENTTINYQDTTGQTTYSNYLTFEAWIKPEVPSSDATFIQPLLARRNTDGSDNFRVTVGNLTDEANPDRGRFQFSLYPNFTRTDAFSTYNDQWQHISGTFNRDTRYLRIYKNGQLVAKSYLPPEQVIPTPNQTGTLSIGRIPGVSEYLYKGAIDELRLSSIIRDVPGMWNRGEYNFPLNPDEDTIALWHFEDSLEESAANLQASVIGNPQYTTGIVGLPITPTPEISPTPNPSPTPTPQPPTPTPVITPPPDNRSPIVLTRRIPSPRVGNSYSALITMIDRDRDDISLSSPDLPEDFAITNCQRKRITTTCEIVGNPTVAGKKDITLIATDTYGAASSRTLLLSTKPNRKPNIRNLTLSPGRINREYSSIIKINDRDSNDAVTLTATNLPPGLTLEDCQKKGRAYHCLLSGTPSSKGTFQTKLTAQDQYNNTHTRIYRFRIR